MPASFGSIERGSSAFWARVAIGSRDDCWPWTGCCVPRAPGRLNYGRWSYAKAKVVRAHRAAWMLDKCRDIPAGLNVLHRCDNPPCCNPAHLFLGTDADNNRDRAEKGRTVRPARDEAAVRYARGAAHGCAKLSPAQVAAIRSDPRSLSQVSRAFGVSVRTCSRIRQGKAWKALIAQASEERK